MKCPKCGYLGFEEAERCRNCGSDFSFAAPKPPPDLSIRAVRAGEPDASPLDDLALGDAAPARRASATPGSDLPLFGGTHDDAPLITRPSPPRTPLAVRRATPEVPRIRGDVPRTPPAPMLDLDMFGEDELLPRSMPPAALRTPRLARHQGGDEAQPAGLGARTAASLVDLAILAIVDAVVVYFTMKICGLTLADVALLPKAPLIAFFVLQNGGYLVAFNAGGQTIGKMAAGIKVVSARPDGSFGVGDSIVRTLVWAALAIPGGLGFLTTFFTNDRRGLHDRCAGTRVVRATA